MCEVLVGKQRTQQRIATIIPRGVWWDLKAEVLTSDITQRPNSETRSTLLRVTPFNLQIGKESSITIRL